MGVTLLITIANIILVKYSGTQLLDEQYIILPAIFSSILVLVVVSLLTPPDSKDKRGQFYTEEASRKLLAHRDGT